MKSPHRPLAIIGMFLALAVVSACSSPATPTATPDPNVVRLVASQDATLYEDPDGALASSAGATGFVGITNRALARRMLVKFDLSSLPADREIVSATLQMRMSKSASGAFEVSLHRATTAWAESTSSASGMGGKGADSAEGDPTWIHSAYPNAFWHAVGGDFVTEPSAVTSVDNFVRYSWSDQGMVSDIAAWISGESVNNGWIVIGDEEHHKTAKRFDAREHENPDRRPTLLIEFAP